MRFCTWLTAIKVIPEAFTGRIDTRLICAFVGDFSMIFRDATTYLSHAVNGIKNLSRLLES